MAGPSKIEWTEATWNPIVGCTIVSPGCTNCYAMGMAYRFKDSYLGRKWAGKPAETVARSVNGKAVWTGQLVLAPDHILLAPLKRKKPTAYFVNSMGDLFHEDTPDEWIDRVFAIMALAPQHTFQVLTKRAARMREYFGDDPARRAGIRRTYDSGLFPHGWLPTWPLPNVWLGVSAERQQELDERVVDLVATPASVRFISAEPLLGPLDVLAALAHAQTTRAGDTVARLLQWLIVGSESGRNARPMDPNWAHSLQAQCSAAGIAFFMKQMSGPGGRAIKDMAAFPPNLQRREMPGGLHL